MNSELRKALADSLSDMERGAAVEDCLKRHPGVVAELRPQLEMWSTMGGAALVQPSTTAFGRGQQAMRAALSSPPAGFSLLTAARMAPAWATVAGGVAAVMILLGGAAGASAALGGPDVAGGVVGVFNNRDDGAANDADDGAVADVNGDCVADASPTPEASPDSDDNRGHGNDADGFDEDNPGESEGTTVSDDADCPEDAVADLCGDANKGHGNDADHDDEDNPGQGEGNHGAEDDTDATPAATDAATEEETEDDAGTACPEDAASEECGDANRGHGNDEDGFDEDNPGQGQGLEERASEEQTVCPEATPDADEEGDENKGHGNDADRTDEDNPGQGEGNHGTGNPANADQGRGNDDKPEKPE